MNLTRFVYCANNIWSYKTTDGPRSWVSAWALQNLCKGSAMKSTSHSSRRNVSRRELKSVKDNFQDEYVILHKMDAGGTGVVYKAYKMGDPDALVAIKFYVPPTQSSLFQETTLRSLILPSNEHVFETEFRFLKKTRHPGIQEIVSWGSLREADKFFETEAISPELKVGDTVPFLVSKFIDGLSLFNWISKLVSDVLLSLTRQADARRLIVNSILDIMGTLAFIHDVKKYQHSDVRAMNIIVHANSLRPILIDFAYAHCFDLDALGADNKLTQIRYFPDNCPPALLDDVKALMKRHNSTEIPREELKSVIFPGLDLYHFGILLKELVSLPSIDSVLTEFDIEFIELVSRRMTNWNVVRSATAEQYKSQLSKLAEGYWVLADRANSFPSTEPIKRVALPKSSLWITSTVEKILETHAFRRLQLLKQLSLIHLVFPGATQTRLEHCLSVYVTASELVHSLVKSPRFCLLFDSSAVTKLLLVALLHDINHFPFLHYFQEMKIEALNSVDLIDTFCDGKATNDPVSLYDILETAGISAEEFKSILFKEHGDLQKPELQVIKSIIDSGADIDKLTYVREDARSTGVPFGAGVDKTALLHAADIVRLREKGDREGVREGQSSKEAQNRIAYHLCFRPEALSAVESLVFARYWNYKQIYWHHTNRAVGAMISHVIFKIFVEKTGSFEEYIKATIGMDESGALRFLDERYQHLFQQPSIVRSIASRREEIYKRFFSLKRSFGDQSRARLFSDIEQLSAADRVRFVEEVAKVLGVLFKRELGSETVGCDDVLLDIPGRPLAQEIGALHVCDLTTDGSPINKVESPFIKTLGEQFQELTKTIRFFISPRIRNKIGKKKVENSYADIESSIRQALDVVRKMNHIR